MSSASVIGTGTGRGTTPQKDLMTPMPPIRIAERGDHAEREFAFVDAPENQPFHGEGDDARTTTTPPSTPSHTLPVARLRV